MELEIYNREAQYQSAVKSLNLRTISQVNKDTIIEFDRYVKVHEKLTIQRRCKYLTVLGKCGELLNKPFEIATKEDIELLVEQIDDSKDWSNSTKRDYKVLLKRFYKWLLTEDDVEYPKLVKWIETTFRYVPSVKSSELLTKDDLSKLLAVAHSARDKAFIHVLYESACRIEELGTLRRKDVTFDHYGALIQVSGKTGERTIRLVNSTGDLHFWFKHQPNKNSDVPVWTSDHSPTEILSYSAFRKILNKHFKLAGVQKKSNPHLFRHSRLTELSKGMSDQCLKNFAGWSRSSNMTETYCHFTGGDVSDKILELNGIKINSESKIALPRACPRCQAPNTNEAQYCYNCSHILDEKLAATQSTTAENIEIQNALSRVLKNKDPEVERFLSILSQKISHELRDS